MEKMKKLKKDKKKQNAMNKNNSGNITERINQIKFVGDENNNENIDIIKNDEKSMDDITCLVIFLKE